MAVGNDEIPIQIVKLINDVNLYILHKLFTEIYGTGIYPDDRLITIPKKNNAKTKTSRL